jgi:hypothetical protein
MSSSPRDPLRGSADFLRICLDSLSDLVIIHRFQRQCVHLIGDAAHKEVLWQVGPGNDVPVECHRMVQLRRNWIRASW